MDKEQFVDGVWRVRQPVSSEISKRRPRVAILHSFYRSELPSGENETVLRQYRWLADSGVDVALVSVATDDLKKSASYSWKTAGRVASGSGLDPTRVFERLMPDVVHVHNTFPNLSSRWIPSSPWAVAVTLHNYRPLCAAATLSRDGQDCRLCLDHSPVHGLVHRCYRNSFAATAAVTVRALTRSDRRTLLEGADVLLAPSGVVREAYGSVGVSPIDILLQPTADRGSHQPRQAHAPALFVGRLTREKGILDLLTSWPASLPLTVVGQGPLENEARKIGTKRGLAVEFAGRISDAGLTDALCSAVALVFPSSWREGAPAVYAEALSAGLPVISLTGNAVADFVRRDHTGVVLEELSQSHLEAAVQEIVATSPSLGARCREIYLRDYTVEVWLERIMHLYEKAIAARATKRYL